MNAFYRKNQPNTSGEELYDKNGNKLDGIFTESQDEPSCPIFDKKGNKLKSKYKKVDLEPCC